MTERRQFVGHTSTAEADQFTGLSREITVDMQAETLRVHDGNTPGGFPLMRADMANLSESTLNSKLSIFQQTKDRVSELNEYSTSLQYPNARCVYKELLTKANVDLDNISEAGQAVINGLATAVAKSIGISEIVPQGKNIVIKFGNGYVLQAGYDDSNAGWRHWLALPVRMADSSYVAITTINGGHSGNSYSTGIQDKSPTGFTVQTNNYENSHNNTYNCPLSWLVIGRYAV